MNPINQVITGCYRLSKRPLGRGCVNNRLLIASASFMPVGKIRSCLSHETFDTFEFTCGVWVRAK